MSSQESSTFPTPASASKTPQVACCVSTTNAEIGKSIIEDNMKEHKKKKRSKSRRARQFTPGETSKTEEKKPDIGPDDIHKDEHAKDREPSTPEKQVLHEKRKELSSFWLELVPKGVTRQHRLPPLEKPNIRLRESRTTVYVIQKYIAQKLNMKDYTEVDVVCCNEKLKGDMTLKDIQHIWKSHLPNSGRKKANWNVKEVVIELGYIRSRKVETPKKK
ncbi:unnamed protein product [Withania somnifera]